MRVLSLFSGGGLGDYGLELAGMEIVGQVEIDDYCQKILKLRWPDVPKWRDIREVKGEEVLAKVGRVDLVSGGFPCQPFSVAGKRRGKQDDRYLWPEMLRIIAEVRPAWVLGENVPGIIKTALNEVLFDLEAIGYATRTITVPACAVDAPHRRERVWIVAYSDSRRCSSEQYAGSGTEKDRGRENHSKQGSSDVADSERMRCGGWSDQGGESRPGLVQDEQEGSAFRVQAEGCGSNPRGWWLPEPAVGRVAHGVANRVDRLKLLGNGQVVQVVEWIGKQIMEFDKREGSKR